MSLLRPKRFVRVAPLILLILATLFVASKPDKIYAAHDCRHPAPEQIYGRNANCGYFRNNSWNGYAPYGGSGSGLLTGIGSPWGNALLGVNNVNTFVAVIRHHLQPGCNPGGGPQDDHRRNAAAFIVLTMQGAPAGTPANAPCTSSAYSINRWESLVREYDSRGLIDYNAQGWYTRNTRIQGGAPDAAWYVDPDCQAFGICIDPSIIVRAPGGNVLYMIKKDCANPIGIPGVLTPLSQPLTINCPSNPIVPTNPTDPEPGEEFSFTVGFTTSGGSGPPATYTIFVDLPAAGIDNGLAAYLGTVARSGGSGSGTLPNPIDNVPNPVINTPGVHNGTYEVHVGDATNSPRTCPFRVTVTSLPYLKLYGGDTLAGAGFNQGETTCTPTPGATLLGYNRQPHLSNFGLSLGTGTQLAAYAFGQIQEFGSGQVRNNLNPATESVKRLTFANSSPSTSNYATTTFGGGLSPTGNTLCAPDYYGTPTAPLPTNSTLPNATYPSPIPANADVSVYVNGNLRITNNIQFSSTTYSSIEEIPSYRVIVRGNIYIDPGVTHLDGIYIAQPTPSSPTTTGRIYTCAPTDNNPPTLAEMNTTCRTAERLTINGAILAQQFKPTRSLGSRSNAEPTDRYNTTYPAGRGPAELIIFSPEVWLTSGPTSSGEFDAIQALPPVL